MLLGMVLEYADPRPLPMLRFIQGFYFLDKGTHRTGFIFYPCWYVSKYD